MQDGIFLQFKAGDGVLIGGIDQLLGIDVVQFCQLFGSKIDQTGIAAFSSVGYRCHIGTIRLDEQAVQRHALCGQQQLIGIFEGDRTGKTDVHSQFQHLGGGFDGLDTSVFHTFGLLWDDTGYTFYVDGKEDGKITDFITARPEFILISTEVRGYRFEDHTPVKEAFDNVGDTFLVDYIRVFERE